MISEYSVGQAPDELFVWIWLPSASEPVVAGRLYREGQQFLFNYGQSYLQREDRIPIYSPELALRRGAILPEPGLDMASCLRDAAPDAWGRRVILNRLLGRQASGADIASLDELSYLLGSGSDRVGALDFQLSASDYQARNAKSATLDELLHAAEKVEKGIPLNPELDQALFHGTSLGGARPKALIQHGDKKLIAKFSSSSDTYNMVKAEYVAMRLAQHAGIDVARVQLERAAGKDVLLIERFDRSLTENGWARRAMVSALTLFGLDELMARYASYQDLAEIIRHRFRAPRASLRELFARLVFNILCGNTDDHARNHAAFWDGRQLSLTPAYDICPQSRSGNIASQAMLIVDNKRDSTLATCLEAAHHFQLDQSAAKQLINAQIQIIQDKWDEVCAEAELTEVDRRLLGQRMFLNESVFEGLADGVKEASPLDTRP